MSYPSFAPDSRANNNCSPVSLKQSLPKGTGSSQDDELLDRWYLHEGVVNDESWYTAMLKQGRRQLK
jgi:hypothetical protein